MRVIIATVLAAAIGYGGYWWAAARLIDTRLAATLTQPAGLPGGARAQGVTVGGFPYRFDVTLTAPELLSPDLHWTSPDLRVQALSYRPHHLIATFAPGQRLRIGGTQWDITQDSLQASLVTRPDAGLQSLLDGTIPRLGVLRGNLAGTGLTLHSDTGSAQIETLRAALREGQTDTGAPAQDLAVEAFNITPTAALRDALDPDATLPPMIARAALQGRAQLAAPLALPGPAPQLDALTLDQIALDWGAFQITGSAALAQDSGAGLDGTITLQISDWPRLLRALVTTGAIGADIAPMAQMMLTGMADPATGRMTLPLVVRGSVASLGPVALFRLPALQP